MSTSSVPSIDILTLPPQQNNSFPDWFNQKRQDAWQEFLNLPFPKIKDETWRFSNLKSLTFENFQPGRLNQSTKPSELAKKSHQIEKYSAKFIFINEALFESESNLPANIIVEPLSEAVKNHPELVQKYFMQKQAQLGSAKFAALHAANTESGIFIYVPANVKIENPIEIFHWIEGKNTIIFPHTLIICEENSSITVVDYFKSYDHHAHWMIGVNDLIAQEGASLKYAAFQELNQKSRSILINDTHVLKDADVKNLLVNLGGTWARQETLSKLDGENANSDMLAVSIANQDQQFDQRTFQHHASPHAKSDLLYKNTLYGNSKTVFSGLIFVDKGAHFTDAYQTCRNMMMSPEAEANSMPGLQINADQVKCSHGSTSAPIDDEEIFYLQARGISPDVARKLIAQGFSAEIFTKFSNPQIETIAWKAIDRKFKSI